MGSSFESHDLSAEETTQSEDNDELPDNLRASRKLHLLTETSVDS